MGKNSKIEWCDHTFNSWWGCTKVSDGCANCYAEVLSDRFKPGYWGTGPRRIMSEGYWKGPVGWNKKAEKEGIRRRVFCGSMCDVFERHNVFDRNLELLAERRRLWLLIDDTSWLDWLLLTKRPENIMDEVPVGWHFNWPSNVWVGTSVEDQATADVRIPELLKVPARVRFLSVEPLLGPVDLLYPKTIWPDGPPECCNGHECGCMGLPTEPPLICGMSRDERINWIIAGGESGPGARPMHPMWAQGILNQCRSYHKVPFLFKQWGAWAPGCFYYEEDDLVREAALNRPHKIVTSEGHFWDIDRDGQPPSSAWIMHNRGKKKAGRLLDGQEWNQFPRAKEIQA